MQFIDIFIKLNFLLNPVCSLLYFFHFYLSFRMCYSYAYYKNGGGERTRNVRFVKGWIIYRRRKAILFCDLLQYRDCTCGKGKNKIHLLLWSNLQHTIPMTGCVAHKNTLWLCRKAGRIYHFGTCISFCFPSFSRLLGYA